MARVRERTRRSMRWRCMEWEWREDVDMEDMGPWRFMFMLPPWWLEWPLGMLGGEGEGEGDGEGMGCMEWPAMELLSGMGPDIPLVGRLLMSPPPW